MEISTCFMFLLPVITIITLSAYYVSDTVKSRKNPKNFVGFNCYPHLQKKETEAQCLHSLLMVLWLVIGWDSKLECLPQSLSSWPVCCTQLYKMVTQRPYRAYDHILLSLAELKGFHASVQSSWSLLCVHSALSLQTAIREACVLTVDKALHLELWDLCSSASSATSHLLF